MLMVHRVQLRQKRFSNGLELIPGRRHACHQINYIAKDARMDLDFSMVEQKRVAEAYSCG